MTEPTAETPSGGDNNATQVVEIPLDPLEQEALRVQLEWEACRRDPLKGSPQSKYSRYDVPVDHEEGDRATKINLCSISRPHMRSLHCAWISFFLAFMIWFAPAPLLKEIRDTLGLTKREVWTSSITNDCTVVFTRIVMGPVCDAFGARWPMAIVLMLASIPTAMVGLVNSAASLAVVRFFIGIAGSSFVMAQFWPSRMFARDISGTANGIVGGWGNLGGGWTQIFMGSILFPAFENYYDGDSEKSWRTICIIPAVIAFSWGMLLPWISDDAPLGNYGEMKKLGSMERIFFTTSLRSGVTRNTWILFIQYAACFGVELVMNNATVLYYESEFGLDTAEGAKIGFIYGSMNIFARAVGGIVSDRLNGKIGMRGRLWLQSTLLLCEGTLIIVFAHAQTLPGAITTMCVFSVFTQASEGAIYGVVPYVSKLYTGAVAGFVGSGGNVGSLVYGIFFSYLEYKTAFILMGSIVVAASFLSIGINIPCHASMLWGEDNHAVINARERFLERRRQFEGAAATVNTEQGNAAEEEVTAEVSCETDEFCRDLYNTSQVVCLAASKTCSNPFRPGCLATKLGEPKRVCNSDDGGDTTYCQDATFEHYLEFRIHNGNWESSIILAWIYQILLSEFAGVPATVGLNNNVSAISSFYSPWNVVAPSEIAYPYDALLRSNEVVDCSLTGENCVHLLPEVWAGQEVDFLPLVRNESIEHPVRNGLLGRSGLQIPAISAAEYPQLAIWHGLAGEENRQFLAETFLRPTSWLEYCTEVSPSECMNASDSVASRFPLSEEEDMYFSQGLFTGFFRATDANNCTANPTTCTGHVVTPPCSWSVPIDSQLYWNDIVGLERDGSLPYHLGGYLDSQMIQIWKAANATGNHVIMHWYAPEPLTVEFFGSSYEFQPVTFPLPTADCMDNRVNAADRCSEDENVRRGDKRGSCGDDIDALRGLFAEIVADTDAVNDVDRSPAYQSLKNLYITNLDIQDIIRTWEMKQRDPYGNDIRDAVCDWVISNLDTLEDAVPQGYPRVLSEKSDYRSWYLFVARVFAAFVSGLAFVCFLSVLKYRNTKSMVFAQPIFLCLIITGFGMYSLGGMMFAREPNRINCLSSSWMLLLGYTIELVPVLVKTYKINQLIASAKKQKRIRISREVMLLEVAGVVVLVLIFLLTWTIVDPPIDVEIRRLVNSHIVELDTRCASSSSGWRLTAFGWQALLLFIAAILAFQSRGVMIQLNESRSLAIMVYSHFMFVCLRGMSSIFYIQGTLPSSQTALVLSLIYSVDAFAAMCIYVLPKLYAAQQAPEIYKPGLQSQTDGVASEDAFLDDDDVDLPELSVLVCSANMGNAEPTEESMKSWIPPGGLCDRVEELDEVSIPHTNFGLIAIGFQEATWTEKSPQESSARGEVVTEQEILNAMENRNTSFLRQMVQGVLGDAYFQIADEQRGQMRLHLWAMRRVAKEVKDVKINGANTGIGNVLANKGGIAMTVHWKNTRISFVSAHLAAHEGESYFINRCENIRSILRESKTFETSSLLDVATSSHHTFFFGDLNFRTKMGEDHTVSTDDRKLVDDLIELKDYGTLYGFDELQEGLAKEALLVGFETPPCDFPPTFKVERQAGIHYKEQRTPSWTDRILYKSSEGLSKHLKSITYEACPDFATSDHKPIRGTFTLLPNGESGSMRVDHELILEFSKLRCSNLKATSSTTKPDPFLMMVWDGVDFRSERIAPFELLRQILKKQSWPRTATIPKAMNPYWQGDTFALGIKNTTVGDDGMLFLTVASSGTVGRDDLLGATALNVKDLIRSCRSQEGQILHLDRPLLKEGLVCGHLKCHVKLQEIERLKNNSTRRRSSNLALLKLRSMRWGKSSRLESSSQDLQA
eukprot:Nitzschia sp. Nitz4//scaffold124_size66437//58765//65003//NITZ4_006121-RA/size66437-processed-gene-0.51-mRNA-1//-1//CDS//3329534582//8837//frame0